MAPILARNFTLKQYFTDAVEINRTMCSLLGDVTNAEVLEPSVGSGSLLRGLMGRPKRIDAVDVDPAVLDWVKRGAMAEVTESYCADFIDMFAGGLHSSPHPIASRRYDAVISNPPFGLYMSPSYRKQLKKSFPDLYTRESFGLFFAFSIKLLRAGGRYVFLMPDTFLTSRNHTSLRRFICANAPPETIIRFPSHRFESVNFGYGSLCIIAGVRGEIAAETRTDWIEAFDNHTELLAQNKVAARSFKGADLWEHATNGWRSGMVDDHGAREGWKTLGDLADCKTGIYTGDNERFIGYDPARVTRRLNGHAVDWEKDVYAGALSAAEQAEGLAEPGRYVPLIRGGHRAFAERTAWCVKWDALSVKFYRSDKKARLQNAGFYFRTGLAVPMVTSKRLTASLIDSSIFDQGVVGVFPKNIADRDALLLYLNSTLATKLRNELVNGSANNSANYLKRLPVPRLTPSYSTMATAILRKALQENHLSQSVCDEFVDCIVTRQDTSLGPSAEI